MRFLLIISLLFTISCSDSMVFSAVTTTGKIIAQERSIGQAIDDTAIFWHIKHLYLQKNAQDLLAGVNVEVIEGRVHLTGNVNTPEARVDAIRLAWQPPGVQEVINEVNINDKKTIKELFQSRWINVLIRSKLALAKEVRSINYSIEVVNGTVYIMGIAQNTTEINRVTNIASKIKGVKKVISHVRLKHSPERNA